MVGAYVLSQGYYDAYYLKAQKIRRLIAMDFLDAFKTCDIILGPVAPTPAWQKGTYSKNPAHMYLADIFTLSASLAGLPCMSVPCGFKQQDNFKLPIGLQLIAPHFAESEILQVANIYQKHTDWHLATPKM
jgi:aspartyl-tRNA(Asn)/glutamyl-tRNA(Gln) amidotransferase subunit A